MKRSLIFLMIVGVLIASWIGWYLISPLFIVLETNEPLPGNETGEMTEMPEIMSVLEGNFMPSAHDVMGNALVIEKDGKRILRFENFETVNGPNLHIYLATDTSVTDYIDLGEIKATKGSVNYDIPEGTDLTKYNTVVVWCVPFKVLFSYAELE